MLDSHVSFGFGEEEIPLSQHAVAEADPGQADGSAGTPDTVPPKTDDAAEGAVATPAVTDSRSAAEVSTPETQGEQEIGGKRSGETMANASIYGKCRPRSGFDGKTTENPAIIVYVDPDMASTEKRRKKRKIPTGENREIDGKRRTIDGKTTGKRRKTTGKAGK